MIDSDRIAAVQAGTFWPVIAGQVKNTQKITISCGTRGRTR